MFNHLFLSIWIDVQLRSNKDVVMLGKTIALVKEMEVVVEVYLYEGVGGGGKWALQEKGSAAKPSARYWVKEEFVL